MSTKNVTLHDENGNILLPATKTSRVTDANGTNLDTLLQQAGQVKSISVNGTAQTIDANGNVDIPSADAINPFKGWWTDLTTLKNTITATDGDYAYVLPSSPNNPVAIYSYDETATSDNYWADSGRIFNPSNNQEFATGEELNTIGITERIMRSSKKLIKSGGVFSAFNILVQLLRKAAYTENNAEAILDALENLISGIDVPITGITIVGDAAIVGSAVYVADLSPTDTTDRDIIWSITSGNEYAAVLSDGTLIVIDNGSVVLKCESVSIPSVYDTKTITVTDSATHIMPLVSNTSDTVGSLTPAKSSYTSISSDGMQFTAGSDNGLSYAYSANFKTFIFDLKYSKSSLAWQYFFGNWAGSNVSTLGFAIKTNTDEIGYTTTAGDYTAGKSLSENTWHRIGVKIISSTSAALWVDGENIITPTTTSKSITHYIFGNNWRFQAANGTRALNGYIKNLKIYDQVLSDDLMTIKTQIL